MMFAKILPFMLATLVSSKMFVTEMMILPTAVESSKGKWLEFYNAGPVPLLVLGGSFVKNVTANSVSFENYNINRTVAPFSYFVVGSNANYSTNGNVLVDIEVPQLQMIQETFGGVDLRVQIGIGVVGIANPVTWGQQLRGPTIVLPWLKGASLSVKNMTAPSNASNWCVSNTVYGSKGDKGTPKAVNQFDCALGRPPTAPIAIAPKAPAVAIAPKAPSAATPTAPMPTLLNKMFVTEMMILPTAVESSKGKWLEFYNAGPVPLLVLSGSFVKTVTANSVSFENYNINRTVAPYSYFVVGSNANYSTNGNVLVDIEVPQLQMMQETFGGVGLQVRNGIAIGGIANPVTWGQQLRGPAIVLPWLKGASLSVKNMTAPSDASNWCVSNTVYGTKGDKGTPKAVNQFDCALNRPTVLAPVSAPKAWPVQAPAVVATPTAKPPTV